MTPSTDRPTLATWSLLALPALVMLLGMQSVRALFPLLVFVLRDRLEWSAVGVGLLAFLLFLTTFLAAPLHRRLGVRRFLSFTIYGLALMRVLMQLWRFDPIGDLALTALAVVCFLLFFPPYLALARANRSKSAGTLTLGLLLGLAGDAALHGAAATLDVSWRTDVVSLLLIGAAALLLLWLQVQLPLLLPRDNDSDTRWPLALTWAGFGAVLFLELLMWLNLARLTQLSGWDQPSAFLWLLCALLAAIVLVTWLPRQWMDARSSAFLLAALLVISLIEIWPTGWAAALQLFVGQVATALLLQIIVVAILNGDYTSGLLHLSVGNGLGMMIFMMASFLFYASYDIALPIPNTVWPLLVGAILGLSAIAARPGPREPRRAPVWQATVVGVALLLAPLVSMVTWQTPATTAA
ncbi:MAG: hypothetical protein HC802_12105, partial [Caldilineaceae bacterium]|nr:hypothetical protein [Caldilineaceae bacterium]